MKLKILILLAIIAAPMASDAQVKIAVSPGAPHNSAMLEMESTSRGFLLPRMTTSQRNSITTPIAGLVVYNTTIGCMELYSGSTWNCVIAGAQVAATGSSYTRPHGVATTPFSSNTSCTSAVISAGYNAAACTGNVVGSVVGVYPKVFINGQCWLGRSLLEVPSSYLSQPTWVNNSMNGWWGYYNNADVEPQAGAGMLYQFSAAMNGSSTERSRGACPVGWHVPSDCEWMYLEHGLGMPTADQTTTGDRGSGNVGSKLSTQTSGGNNGSGFTAILAGYRQGSGTFTGNTSEAYFWTSTNSTASANIRRLSNGITGVTRTLLSPGFNAYSVRCLAD